MLMARWNGFWWLKTLRRMEGARGRAGTRMK